jgi:hypothetical protein
LIPLPAWGFCHCGPAKYPCYRVLSTLAAQVSLHLKHDCVNHCIYLYIYHFKKYRQHHQWNQLTDAAWMLIPSMGARGNSSPAGMMVQVDENIPTIPDGDF